MKVKMRCPSCKRALRPVQSMNAATQLVRRTCRNCWTKWNVVVEPVTVREGARVDKLTWNRIKTLEVTL